MKKIVFIIVAFCLMISPIISFGAEKIKFGSFPIPLMVVDEEKGVFVELTKTISERAGIEIEIIVIPPKRIISYFLKNQVDVLFPALDVNFPTGKEPIKSEELIYTKTDFIFTKKGNPLITDLMELEGKRVGITLGYPYVRELIDNNLITIEQANSDGINMKKLMKGRINAFVVEEQSGLNSLKNTGLKDEIQYNPNAPISRQDVYYAFQNNEKGKKLSQKISKVLGEMKKDGTFMKIMQKASQQN